MTTENQKTILEHSREAETKENISKVPVDSELFTSEVHEEPSIQQIFAGDEDFYKSLMESDESPIPIAQKFSGTSRPKTGPTADSRFSTIQKVLAASIVLTGAMLLYALLKSPQTPVADLLPAQTQPPEAPSAEPPQTMPGQTSEPKPALEPTQPLSLKVAQSFYLDGDYDKAFLAYENLRQNLPSAPEEDLMRDFLQMQMALCTERTADYEQAGRLFRSVLNSRSPIIKVIANYYLSQLEMQKNQYLNARTRAYQAVALVDAIDFDRDWVWSLKQDCYFLTAQTITRNVLSLRDADRDLPKDLWTTSITAAEPFISLNETQLRNLLNSGSTYLSKSTLGPQIQKLNHEDNLPRYAVICHGAPTEELLTRFTANANLELHWNLDAEEIGIRKQAVNLYLPETTTQQFVTTAAGCAGLLARLDENNVVNISDPAKYSYVSEHISLLTEEAISLWQKFLLRFHDDHRTANAHFALGLLQAQRGEVAESLAEYKLLANRFSSSSLAPSALLNSSKLKTGMCDYPGARQDLKQLVEQFPDSEIVGKAYLYLADTTAKAGLETEAARLYRKVYYLSMSSESQSTAARGAGECYYQIKDYESAEKWLTLYIKLAEGRKSKDLYLAYFLLGKTNLALGKPEIAFDAFRYALETGPAQLSKEEYTETVSALVEGYIQQGHLIQALNMLENIPPEIVSQKESIAILLLKSKVLVAMRLIDKAIAILGDRAEYISAPQLKARISYELATCYIIKGNLERAREKLAETLVVAEPGPLAYEIALKLAEVCLKLNQNSQAVSVCSQLLKLEPPEQIKQKTLYLLATAYNQQKDYDRAALALLDQWK